MKSSITYKKIRQKAFVRRKCFKEERKKTQQLCLIDNASKKVNAFYSQYSNQQKCKDTKTSISEKKEKYISVAFNSKYIKDLAVTSS